MNSTTQGWNESAVQPTGSVNSFLIFPYSLQIFLGFVCIPTNAQILTVLVGCRKQFSTKSYVYIGALAVADLANGCAYVFINIGRLSCIVFDTVCGGTQRYCANRAVFLRFGVQASNMFSLLLSFDRLAAVLRPVRYRAQGVSVAFGVATLGWLYTFVEVAAMLIGPSETKMLPSCTVVRSMEQTYSNYSTTFGLSTNFLTVALYVALFLATKKQAKVGQAGATTTAGGRNAQQSGQSRTARSISLILLVFVVTSVSSRVLFWSYSVFLPAEVRNRFGPITRNLQLVNSAANYFIFMTTNSKFVEAWKSIFCCKPLTSSVSATSMSKNIGNKQSWTQGLNRNAEQSE